MTRSDSISQLEETLNSLQTLIVRMKESSGIHQIDIDLLQQKARNLYEQILALDPGSFQPVKEVEILMKKDETEVVPEPEPENVSAPSEEEGEKTAAEMEPEPEPEEMDTPEETTVEMTENQEAEKPDAQAEVYEEEVIDKVVDVPEKEMAEIASPKTTLDLFSESADETLGAALSQSKSQPNVGETLEQAPVGDLREAIGINDKFQFINELFNGDMDEYNKTLDELNHFSNLQGAMTYLSELSIQHDFQKNSVAFQRLESLITKKYA